ncbi:hypothetical protein ACFVRD_45285, partial [Streptomyces sp. NPDC057908]|uniref:hypothetical protein n=1 Tax=Streptomyces sp. NPDC057908 TaxID=3346276 RepID=UPI0036DFDCC7
MVTGGAAAGTAGPQPGLDKEGCAKEGPDPRRRETTGNTEVPDDHADDVAAALTLFQIARDDLEATLLLAARTASTRTGKPLLTFKQIAAALGVESEQPAVAQLAPGPQVRNDLLVPGQQHPDGHWHRLGGGGHRHVSHRTDGRRQPPPSPAWTAESI